MKSLNERLIEEVRKREHLYNMTSSDYKDAILKENSWEAIASVLQVDASEAKKRWKSLRDTYSKKAREAKRLSRSGAGATKTEKWPYFAILGFLRDHVKSRTSFCSFTPAQEPAIPELPEQSTSTSKGQPAPQSDSENSVEENVPPETITSTPKRSSGREKLHPVDRAILEELSHNRKPNDIAQAVGECFDGDAGSNSSSTDLGPPEDC